MILTELFYIHTHAKWALKLLVGAALAQIGDNTQEVGNGWFFPGEKKIGSFQRAIALEIPPRVGSSRAEIPVCCVILPGRRMAGSALPSHIHLMPTPGPWAGMGISEGFRSLEMEADCPSNLSVLYCSRITSGVAGQDLLLHPSASALEGQLGMEREQQGRGLRPGLSAALKVL